MKVKALVAICKRQKRFFLYDGNENSNVQWLGDGCAVYPLLKMPPLNEQNIYTIFDIPEKQQSKMHFTQNSLPEGIEFEDVAACENMLDPAKIEIGYAGRILRPLHTSYGLIFIDVQYLSPLSDMADMIELYERVDRSGNPYIAVKNGFMLVAIIMPYKVIKPDFVEQLKELTKHCEIALSVLQDKEKTAETL